MWVENELFLELNDERKCVVDRQRHPFLTVASRVSLSKTKAKRQNVTGAGKVNEKWPTDLHFRKTSRFCLAKEIEIGETLARIRRSELFKAPGRVFFIVYRRWARTGG